MNKSKKVRLIGFVGALGVSAALIAAASSGTGAYFTDSANGNLSGASGSLALSATSPTSIKFTGMNPGVDKSQTIDFGLKSTSTTDADVWLVFDSSSTGYGNFTGAKTSDALAYGGVMGGGLGQYGHFKLAGPAGTFESYNLQLPDVDAATGGYSSAGTANTCTVNKYGLGGSARQHTVGAGNDIAECGVPGAILLKSNLAPGATSSATLTFGLTGKAETQNKVWADVGFKIVATQPGVSPVGATW